MILKLIRVQSNLIELSGKRIKIMDKYIVFYCTWPCVSCNSSAKANRD